MRAWRAWLEYVEDRHAAKAKTHNAAAFWRNHQAAIAFQQWQLQAVIAREMKGKTAVILGRLRNSAQVCTCSTRIAEHSAALLLYQDSVVEDARDEGQGCCDCAQTEELNTGMLMWYKAC